MYDMSFLGFFTGENDKIEEMEALVNQGLYMEALKIDFKSYWALSNDDYNKIMYLSAVSWFGLGRYGDAQKALVSILNNPSGTGNYLEKAKNLRRKISEKERGNTIVFPQESFTFLIEDCFCDNSAELRSKEGIDDTNYYEKIQIFDNGSNKRLTFYWKPLSADESEFFAYLGDDIDSFCKKVDENTIERHVYTKSLKNIGELYERGKNGACFKPSLYRTVDYTKPDVLLKGNSYVLGVKTRRTSFSQVDELENEITQLLETFGDIMSDIDKGPTTIDKIKIYTAYFGQGVIDEVLSQEFKEVGKLISSIMKNK